MGASCTELEQWALAHQSMACSHLAAVPVDALQPSLVTGCSETIGLVEKSRLLVQ
jgi:hypothetical protein